jgi:hypothetical protein
VRPVDAREVLHPLRARLALLDLREQRIALGGDALARARLPEGTGGPPEAGELHQPYLRSRRAVSEAP